MSSDITCSIREFPTPDGRKSPKTRQLMDIKQPRIKQSTGGLIKTNDFMWTNLQEEAFVRSANVLIQPIMNIYFDIEH